MTVEYTNRKGRTHLLHQGTTKTGKPKYFFSMKTEGNLVDTIPPGYEIYENPNAQVFLRRIPAKVFTDEEMAIVQNGIQQFVPAKDFIVDVKDKKIIIYLVDQDPNYLLDLAKSTWRQDPEGLQAVIARSLTYSPMMQFVLVDAKSREFVVERWCFLGSVDDWIEISNPASLQELVQTYGQHLGKESFFDLRPGSA